MSTKQTDNSDTGDNTSDNTSSNMSNNTSEDLEVSKSERKRRMHYLQELAEQLSQLKSSQWESLTLPTPLNDALLETRRITKREAKRRHLQFLGKVMRKLDDEQIASIEKLLTNIKQARQQSTEQFHQLEKWRDRLLSNNRDELEAFLLAYPTADRQWLRQTLRNHQAEIKAQKPPMAARKLFQYLRDITNS